MSQSRITRWVDERADQWQNHPLLMRLFYPWLPKAPGLGQRLRLRNTGLDEDDEIVLSAFLSYWTIYSVKPLDGDLLDALITEISPNFNAWETVARMNEEGKLSWFAAGDYDFWWPKWSLMKRALRQGQCVYSRR